MYLAVAAAVVGLVGTKDLTGRSAPHNEITCFVSISRRNKIGSYYRYIT